MFFLRLLNCNFGLKIDLYPEEEEEEEVGGQGK